jgi:hypothetical protein
MIGASILYQLDESNPYINQACTDESNPYINQACTDESNPYINQAHINQIVGA